MFTTLQWHRTLFHLSFQDIIAMVYIRVNIFIDSNYYLPLIYCLFINRPRVTVNVAVDTLVNHVLFLLLPMRSPTNGSQFHRLLQFSVLGLLIQSYTLRRVIFYLPLEVCTFCNLKKNWNLNILTAKQCFQWFCPVSTWPIRWTKPPEGGGRRWFWGGGTRWVCAAEQVWFSGSWLLNRVFTI